MVFPSASSTDHQSHPQPCRLVEDCLSCEKVQIPGDACSCQWVRFSHRAAHLRVHPHVWGWAAPSLLFQKRMGSLVCCRVRVTTEERPPVFRAWWWWKHLGNTWKVCIQTLVMYMGQELDLLQTEALVLLLPLALDVRSRWQTSKGKAFFLGMMQMEIAFFFFPPSPSMPGWASPQRRCATSMAAGRERLWVWPKPDSPYQLYYNFSSPVT